MYLNINWVYFYWKSSMLGLWGVCSVYVCVCVLGGTDNTVARQRVLITHSFVWILLWGHWYRQVSGTWTLNTWRGRIKHVFPGSWKRLIKWWDVCVRMCPVGSDSLQLHGQHPPRLLCHRISWAGILEWDALSYSKGSSRPKDRTCISCPGIESISLVSPALVGWFLITVSPGKPKRCDIKL